MKKILLIASLLSLFGCAAQELRSGAEKVQIMQAVPANYNCKFLGDITGSQGNRFTGGVTSNENLETGARNDLKNKAYELGGNVIILITNRAGQTGSYDPVWGGSSAQTNVTLSGSVYRCTKAATAK